MPYLTLFLTALTVLLWNVGGAECAPPLPGMTRAAIRQAEYDRAATADQLQLLVMAATSATPEMQVLAVRALGRLERPALKDRLVPLLGATNARVRAEAADAIAQTCGRDAGCAASVQPALVERLQGEKDADARGAICEALGRLPIEPPAEIAHIERVLFDVASRTEVIRNVAVTQNAAGTRPGSILALSVAPKTRVAVPAPALIGALRGLESLSRLEAKRHRFSNDTIDRLRHVALDTHDATSSLAAARRSTAPDESASIRRLAMRALLPMGGVDLPTVQHALDDPDDQVRRLALLAPAADRAAVDRGLQDSAWLVRVEALTVYGRRFQATAGCQPILAAIGATADHVSLLAIDLLGRGCRPEDRAADLLLDLAVGISSASQVMQTPPPGVAVMHRWHAPAHAIVSLAKIAPDQARPELQHFLKVEPWQARMYAAHAATELGDAAVLRSLARDPDANVREAAVGGLAKTVQHGADPVYVEALRAKDYQLVMTAAGALSGTPDRSTAIPALLAALARLTADDSDTSRDPRQAILDRLKELGGRDQAAALGPYLSDSDTQIADSTAGLISAWTGAPVKATPAPRRRFALTVTDGDVARLAKTRVRVTIKDLGSFELRLFADFAPASSARFEMMAREGYYNGLTFHRVLPNFLIQGGSFGANEFAGSSRYMPDEVGRISQTRGTLGTSTRGRDTGDAQFYINLVDTPRLDHDYTIFAEVVRGMDVVGLILEGDVIEGVKLSQ
ncbi:MAG TPA: peptidylprolyl isomerase [Vicinamibacterales bacterium]|jgi:cyclophilin family peptidyl-prolyl cis-trans isomerase/HEAT repeat protein